MKRCECCGVPLGDSITDKPRCYVCRACNGVHGTELEQAAIANVRAGKLSPWSCVALMALDDAHLCGTLALLPRDPVSEPQSDGTTRWVARLDFSVTRTPRPWERYTCRMFAKNERPGISEIVNVAVATHFGRPNTDRVRAEVRREVLDAMIFCDPDIVDIEIVIKGPGDIGPRDEINIEIVKRTNIEPGAVVMVPDVEIPADVLARKPAQA